MATLTVTVTTAHAAHAAHAAQRTVCVNQSSTRTDENSQIERLEKILDQFQDWHDALSLSMRDWGRNAIRMAKAPLCNSTQDERRLRAQEQLNILAREILVSCFDKKPLEKPVREREWTWPSQEMYDIYRKAFAKSPLDNQPWSEHPEVHSFAVAMKEWLSEVQSSFSTEIIEKKSEEDYLDEKELARLADSKSPSDCRTLRQITTIALSTQQQKMIQQQYAETLHYFGEELMIAKSETARAVAAAKKAAEEEIATIRARIEGAERTFKTTMQALNEREALSQNTIKALEERLKTVDKSNAALYASISDELTKAKESQEASQRELTARFQVEKQQYQASITRLETELKLASERNEKAMAEMEDSDRARVSALQSQVSRANDQTADLRAQVEKDKKIQDELLKRADSLTRSLSLSTAEIERLREDYENRRDRCVML